MKLAFTTLGCPDWTFEQILERAQALGYQAIEIRGIEGEMLAEKIGVFQPGRQQDTLRRLQAHGLEICGFGSSVRFDEPEKIPAMLDEGKAAIDVCARMEIPYVRVFGDRINDASEEARVIADASHGIAQLCEYAQGTNVGILLEVHGNFNYANRVLQVYENVGSDKLGVLWDIEHSDKTYGDDFEAFYRPISKYVRHIHVKDHHRAGGELQLCHVGDGDIPIPAIVDMLRRDGYSGYYSLEWEKKWHPELPDCETEFPSYAEFMRKL